MEPDIVTGEDSQSHHCNKRGFFFANLNQTGFSLNIFIAGPVLVGGCLITILFSIEVQLSEI